MARWLGPASVVLSPQVLCAHASQVRCSHTCSDDSSPTQRPSQTTVSSGGIQGRSLSPQEDLSRGSTCHWAPGRGLAGGSVTQGGAVTPQPDSSRRGLTGEGILSGGRCSERQAGQAHARCSHGGQVHAVSRLAALVPGAELGGGRAQLGPVDHVRAEGLRVGVAAGAAGEGPHLGFVLEGSSHL